MPATRKKKTLKQQKQEAKRNRLIFSFITIFICIFAIFRLGYLGRQAANIFRIFAGNLFQIFALGMIACLIYFLLKKPMRKKKTFFTSKRVFGIAFIYFGILLINHILMFASYTGDTPNILRITWDVWLSDFSNGTLDNNVGGGFFGALIYTATFFLVAQLGSWIIAITGILLGNLFIFNLHLHDIRQFFVKVNERFAPDPDISAQKEEIRTQKQENRRLKKEEKAKSKKEKQQRYLNERIEELRPEGEAPRLQTSPVIQSANEVTASEPPKISISSQRNVEPVQENLFEEEEIFSTQKEYIAGIDYDAETGEVLGEKEAKEARENETTINNLGIYELDNPNYKLPKTNLLDPIPPSDQSGEIAIAEESAHKLASTFESFKVNAQIKEIQIGPAVTKFEVKPAIGVPVSRFKKMTDDIQLALGAKDLRMEAPIPGKSLIGIEVPNAHISPVSYRDIAEHMNRHSDKLLEVPLGKDIYGSIQTMDLSSMPHLLVAGATGSGKSVAVNGIITGILLKAKPHQVKMVMVDPKMVELSVYNGIPHLLTPVVTNPKKAAQALNKVVEEMERRYELFAQFGIRKIDSYNNMVDMENVKLQAGETPHPKMPYIVVIVDEMADLMMVAGKEVEAAIVRLAQKARAAGIHMILATQRPSVDVITGLIKANIPSRMAFAVSSGVDSRTILDQQGAEKLLGRGDMLFSPVGASHPIRVQGAFLSDQEVEKIVEFVKNQQEVEYNANFDPGETNESGNYSYESGQETIDPRYNEIKEHVVQSGKASKSEWQRVFKMNFNTATTIMDQLEAQGIVGPDEGKKPRRVLVQPIEEIPLPFDEEESVD